MRRAVHGEPLATWRQCGARSHLPKRLRRESRLPVLQQTQGSVLPSGYHCLRSLREKYFLNSYIAASQNLCQVNVEGVNLYRTGVADPESLPRIARRGRWSLKYSKQRSAEQTQATECVSTSYDPLSLRCVVAAKGGGGRGETDGPARDAGSTIRPEWLVLAPPRVRRQLSLSLRGSRANPPVPV
ncbi:hypothetical protein E2C01_000926 [Portunus trituberculatus]|uniref:Uncharacterized protein n=1 Tax=Portunus trituberculatus TaxID=210409 RepID=A0A5B7CFE2_PORTR|nr:hypothetical protein [Portunus trituberculatus]